jgi:RNA polymerase sigma factor (TIGR02999 family)
MHGTSSERVYWRLPFSYSGMRKQRHRPEMAEAETPETGVYRAAEDVTRLLAEFRTGDRTAFDRAAALMYDELRRLAARQLRRERPDHTLLPTALVHEAYVRLSAASGLARADRAHFLAVAAHAMRQLLIDHARQRAALKRGGDVARTTLDGEDVAAAAGNDDDELLALDAALERLRGFDERALAVVEQRFFAGLAEAEIAAVLGVSTRTVRREWVKARAWLHKELYGPGTAP